LGTKKDALMFLECISAGAVFNGGITIRNFSVQHLGLLKAILKLTNDQFLRLGSNKSRGFGALKIDVEQITCEILDSNADVNKTILSEIMKLDQGKVKKKENILGEELIIEGTEADKLIENALSTIKNKK
jgi:CRISPR/Cas system CSM-associated protein Csm3 (group 7 of RAMP superfamily)